MVRKRKRPSTTSKSTAAATSTSTPTVTKLKKPRQHPFTPPPPAKPPSPTTNQQSLDSTLTTLSTRIDSALHRATTSRFADPPPHDLIPLIQSLLPDVPIPNLLSHLPKLPHLLLIAARKGTTPPTPPHTPTSILHSLIHTLTTMASGALTPLPDTHPPSRPLRSAFRASNPTSHQLQLANKAGNWALHLLTSCLRGDPDPSHHSHQRALPRSLRHTDTTAVFVTPRDSLDKAIKTHCVALLTQTLHHLPHSNRHPLPDLIRVLHALCHDLAPVVAAPASLPILEALLLALGTLPMPITQTAVNDALRTQPLIPQSFLDSIMNVQNGQSVFANLSAKTRYVLLRASPRAWETQLKRVEERFQGKEGVAGEEEELLVSELAHVAAVDVLRHWEFMDRVRTEIASETEPFSIELWKGRRFCRAVLKETARVVGRARADEGRSSPVGACVAVFRRFPRRFQHVVQGVEALAESAGRNVMSGVKGLEVVVDGFGLDESADVCADAHATLLCMEGLLESLCWCSGYAMAGGGGGVRVESGRICEMIGLLSAVLGVIRMPGGKSAESEGIVRRRTGVMAGILRRLVRGGMFPERRDGEWRVNGLLGMGICGVVSGRGIGKVDGFYSGLEEEEKYELRRGVEMTRVLGGEGLVDERELFRRVGGKGLVRS